jgi:hypothetical protein
MFKCHICHFESATKSHLKRHITSVHEKEKIENKNNESKEIYNKYSKSVKEILGQVSDPQDRKKRLFQYIITDSETGLEACSFCQKVFQGPQPSIRQRKLMDHIDSVHLKIRSYECQFCYKKYPAKSNLCTHLKLKHSNVQVKDKKLQVPRIKSKTLCQKEQGKKFHVKSKTTIYPMCEICYRTFVNKDQLNVHSCHAIKQESQEIMESVIEGSQNDQKVGFQSIKIEPLTIKQTQMSDIADPLLMCEIKMEHFEENEATPIQDLTAIYIKQEEFGAFGYQNEQEKETIVQEIKKEFVLGE